MFLLFSVLLFCLFLAARLTTLSLDYSIKIHYLQCIEMNIIIKLLNTAFTEDLYHIETTMTSNLPILFQQTTGLIVQLY